MSITKPVALSVVGILLALLPLGSACEHKRLTVTAVEEDKSEEEPYDDPRSEIQLRARHEAQMKARENQPEPELDPTEPREKLELVWRMGGDQIRSIYQERSEMIAMLRRIKLDDREEAALVKLWIERLSEFGVGRESASLERAPQELCRLLTEVRAPVDRLVDQSMAEIRRIDEETAKLDAVVEAGGSVFQDQWDKLDKQRKRWTPPAKAGRQILLVVKSMLDEAYVLAEHGARRTQIALRDCLTQVAERPLQLDLAQEQLEKVISRSKWYRDLR